MSEKKIRLTAFADKYGISHPLFSICKKEDGE